MQSPQGIVKPAHLITWQSNYIFVVQTSEILLFGIWYYTANYEHSK